MLKFFYKFIFCLGLMTALPFLWPSVARGKYRKIGLARLGLGSAWLPNVKPGGIWLHALSVGEVNSSLPLVKALLARFPGDPFYFSVSTATGLATAQAALGSYEQVTVFIRPLDVFWAVRRLCMVLKPKLFCLVESDLWPAWHWQLKKQNVPLALVNSRISPRTLRGYQKLGRLAKMLFADFDLIFCQSELDRKRLLMIDLAEAKLKALGNLKYDSTPSRLTPEQKECLASDLGVTGRTLLLAGSTYGTEEDCCLAALRSLRLDYPGLALLLAPRDVSRGREVALKASALGFKAGRLSRQELPAEFDVYILDKLGYLARTYALAPAAFVGGSLEDHGGHNLLEPAAQAAAVLFGPHTADFAEMAEALLDLGGGVRLTSPGELKEVWAELLANPDRALAIGQNAYNLCLTHSGATERVADMLGTLVAGIKENE